MSILVVLAHPDPTSLNHAIAAECRAVLLEAGHTVWYHDLYLEGFDPRLDRAEVLRGATLDPQTSIHCRQLADADGIVIVHPNWWGQPPALLKGWIDRAFRPGVAYRFDEGDSGEGVPVGLLKARTALVFNTGNTPFEREVEVFLDPLDTLWRTCILGLCGVQDVRRRLFTVVVTSTVDERKKWLQEVRLVTLEAFPSPRRRQ